MLYYLGGCHVSGFPVGLEFSFPSLVKSRHGFDFLHISRPTSIKNALNGVKNLNVCGDDILIFQLGNYEANFSIRPKFIKKNSNKSSNISYYQGKTFYGKNKMHRRTDNIYRVPFLHLYELLGLSYFDKNMIENNLRELFNYLKNNFAGKVYIISALPTLDSATNIYREWISCLFRDMSRHYNFVYVDVYKHLVAECINSGECSVFIDDFHLNKDGHEIVSKILSDCLLENKIE